MRDSVSTSARWSPEDLLAVLAALDRATEVTARRIELGVLRVLGPRLLWTDACTLRLRRLRSHPSASVQSAARSLWIRPE